MQRPLEVGDGLSALLLRPDSATALVVLAHGAGAGYQHAGMAAIASAFADAGLATLRFNFPFMQAGRRRVDSPAVSNAAIAAAVEAAARQAPDLPLYLGGHSFGGRMASHAVLERALSVSGLIFCSFPLHGAGKPGVARAAHLPEIRLPMLFLSGTRDALADSKLLSETVASLPRVQLHWLETADHSYRVLKRQRRDDVFEEMAAVAAEFVERTRPQSD